MWRQVTGRLVTSRALFPCSKSSSSRLAASRQATLQPVSSLSPVSNATKSCFPPGPVTATDQARRARSAAGQVERVHSAQTEDDRDVNTIRHRDASSRADRSASSPAPALFFAAMTCAARCALRRSKSIHSPQLSVHSINVMGTAGSTSNSGAASRAVYN